MKILLHTCCGPCSIYPVKTLRNEGYTVMGYFYRHNIHPFTECLKREETLKEYSETIDFPVIYQKGYELEQFLQNVTFRETNRCAYCYHERMLTTALTAKRGKFDFFSTTLLYSRFQNHELLQSIGEAVAKKAGVKFLYRDFRDGWKEGIEESKKIGLYRQQYCGCIYSEKERFYKDTKDNN